MIKGAKYILACLVIVSFTAVITADYWRSPNVASVVILEIEPKKNTEKRSDASDEPKQDPQENFFGCTQPVPQCQMIDCIVPDRYLEKYSTPHLSSSFLPPELI